MSCCVLSTCSSKDVYGHCEDSALSLTGILSTISVLQLSSVLSARYVCCEYPEHAPRKHRVTQPELSPHMWSCLFRCAHQKSVRPHWTKPSHKHFTWSSRGFVCETAWAMASGDETPILKGTFVQCGHPRKRRFLSDDSGSRHRHSTTNLGTRETSITPHGDSKGNCPWS